MRFRGHMGCGAANAVSKKYIMIVTIFLSTVSLSEPSIGTRMRCALGPIAIRLSLPYWNIVTIIVILNGHGNGPGDNNSVHDTNHAPNHPPNHHPPNSRRFVGILRKRKRPDITGRHRTPPGVFFPPNPYECSCTKLDTQMRGDDLQHTH